MEVGSLYLLVGLLTPFVTTSVLLWLQIRAYLRHRHRSFRLLVVSSVLGMAYLACGATISACWMFGELAPSWLYATSMTLVIAECVLGVWGTMLLFRSYRDLAESAFAPGARADRS